MVAHCHAVVKNPSERAGVGGGIGAGVGVGVDVAVEEATTGTEAFADGAFFGAALLVVDDEVVMTFEAGVGTTPFSFFVEVGADITIVVVAEEAGVSSAGVGVGEGREPTIGPFPPVGCDGSEVDVRELAGRQSVSMSQMSQSKVILPVAVLYAVPVNLPALEMTTLEKSIHPTTLLHAKPDKCPSPSFVTR